MAGDVTLKIDADVQQYISKVGRASQATKRMARDASDIGDAFSGAIIKIEVLKRAITAAGQTISQILDKNRGASKSQGERAVGLTTSLGSLGVKNASAAADQITGSRGLANLEQRSSFAAALASASAARRTPFTEAQSMKAIQAYTNLGDTTFGAGGSELLKGLDRGLGVEEITAASVRKRGGLVDPYSAAGRELALQEGADTAQLETEQQRGAAGEQQRQRDIAAGRTSDRQAKRGALYEAADAFIPGFAKEAINRGAEALGLRTAAADAQNGTIQQSLELNRLLRSTLTKPNLNTTAGE